MIVGTNNKIIVIKRVNFKEEAKDVEATNPSEKMYARLSEQIGQYESCETQRATNGIYQCVGVQQGIWLLKTMATHPLTMISCVKLLQLIHIDWL